MREYLWYIKRKVEKIMQKEYIKVVKEKGEFDFEVNSAVIELKQEEYEELKSMLITAIGTMEEMRRYGKRI